MNAFENWMSHNQYQGYGGPQLSGPQHWHQGYMSLLDNGDSDTESEGPPGLENSPDSSVVGDPNDCGQCLLGDESEDDPVGWCNNGSCACGDGQAHNVSGNDGSQWVKVKAVVDSGAVETIAPEGYIEKDKIKQTAASRNGAGWKAAEGSKILNKGEGLIQGKSDDGMKLNTVSQIGDKAKRMLLAVSRIAEAGNAVMFNVDKDLTKKLAKSDKLAKDFIVNKGNLNQTRIELDKGLYVLPMWIKKPQGNVHTVLDQKAPEDAWFPF